MLLLLLLWLVLIGGEMAAEEKATEKAKEVAHLGITDEDEPLTAKRKSRIVAR